MRYLIILLVLSGCTTARYTNVSDWCEDNHALDPKGCSAIAESEKESAEALAKTKTLIMVGDVPTFKTTGDVEIWAERYNGANPVPKRPTQWLNYTDSNVCVRDESDGETWACFDLYDITER